MADYNAAFEIMIQNEGGYQLTKIPGDRGGQTYAGIARASWPDWLGWRDIDHGQIPDTALVRRFYRVNFWDRVRGDDITSQSIARSLFDFAVNAGDKVAIKLAQIVIGATPDGSPGEKTLAALNAVDPELFTARYTLAKIARYRDIVARDKTQGKFFLGWINRALKESA